MNDIIDKITNLDRNSQILLIAIGVISILLVIIFIYNFVNSRNERKLASLRRKNRKELKRQAKQEMLVEPKKEEVPVVIEKKEEPKFEEPVIPVIVEKEEPVETLEVLMEEESDVDRIIDDMKNASNMNNMFDLTEFEREQEESAIISYEELCRKAGVEQKIYAKEEKPVQKEVTHSQSMFKDGYRRTQMISPIFGIQNDKEEIL